MFHEILLERVDMRRPEGNIELNLHTEEVGDAHVGATSAKSRLSNSDCEEKGQGSSLSL